MGVLVEIVKKRHRQDTVLHELELTPGTVACLAQKNYTGILAETVSFPKFRVMCWYIL